MSENDDDFGDEEGGGGDGGGHEVAFDDETAGVLIAGRVGDMGGVLTRAGLGKLKLAIDELSKAKGLTLQLVPSGDNSETGPSPDDAGWGSFVIGIVHAHGGTYGPEQMAREHMLQKVEAAKALSADVWQAVAALLPESRRESFLESEISLQLVPVGPLACAMLAFGAEGTEEDAGEGEYHRGQHMDQEPHSEGVWGQLVVSCEDPETVDLSESAHQARVAAFPEGKYFLIARYD